jgi:hypothetical protein
MTTLQMEYRGSEYENETERELEEKLAQVRLHGQKILEPTHINVYEDNESGEEECSMPVFHEDERETDMNNHDEKVQQNNQPLYKSRTLSSPPPSLPSSSPSPSNPYQNVDETAQRTFSPPPQHTLSKSISASRPLPRNSMNLRVTSSFPYNNTQSPISSASVSPPAFLATPRSSSSNSSHPIDRTAQRAVDRPMAAEYSYTYTETSDRPRRTVKRPNTQRYHTCNPALLYSRLSTMKAEAEVRRSQSRGNTPFSNADSDSEDEDDLNEAELLRRLSTEKARKASRDAQKFLSGGATMTHADVQMMFRMMQNDFVPTSNNANPVSQNDR